MEMEMDQMYHSTIESDSYKLPSLGMGGVSYLDFQMESFYMDQHKQSQEVSLPHFNSLDSMLSMKQSLYTDNMLSIPPQQSDNFYESQNLSIIPMLQTTPNPSSDDEKISALWGSLESASEMISPPNFGINITPPDSAYESFPFGDTNSDPFSPNIFLDASAESLQFQGRGRSNSSLSLYEQPFSDASIVQASAPRRQRSASNPNPDKKKKVFYCHLCPTTFSRNHDLKRHIRIHLGIRPHKCQTCPKSFTRADALHRHVHVRGCRGV